MKTLACLVTAALMTLAGLHAVPASAEPYPHSVVTDCNARTKTPITRSTRPVIRFNWFTAGNAAPRGNVTIRVVNRLTGEVVVTARRAYHGKANRWVVHPLAPGRYKVRVVARAGASSVFKGCSAGARLRVKR